MVGRNLREFRVFQPRKAREHLGLHRGRREKPLPNRGAPVTWFQLGIIGDAIKARLRPGFFFCAFPLRLHLKRSRATEARSIGQLYEPVEQSPLVA